MSYPREPGWRSGPNSATSKAAAISATARAPGLVHVIAALLGEGPATPEEMTATLLARGNRQLLNTGRARCTQLHRLGRITASGTFGLGESGVAKAIRWRLCTPEELALRSRPQGGRSRAWGTRP